MNIYDDMFVMELDTSLWAILWLCYALIFAFWVIVYRYKTRPGKYRYRYTPRSHHALRYPLPSTENLPKAGGHDDTNGRKQHMKVVWRRNGQSR